MQCYFSAWWLLLIYYMSGKYDHYMKLDKTYWTHSRTVIDEIRQSFLCSERLEGKLPIIDEIIARLIHRWDTRYSSS